METTIDYASDYGGEASDYQTTMEGKPETENDYGGKARDGKRLSILSLEAPRATINS